MISNKTLLIELLLQGNILVTPNNRLSNQLLNDAYTHTSRTVIEKPLCFPYTTFLRNIFEKIVHLYPLHNHPTLLTPEQSYHLWQKILQDKETRLLYPGMVESLQEAWTRCQHWNISVTDNLFSSTPQTEQYAEWHNTYAQHLDNTHAITEEELVAYIMKYPMALPTSTIVWACFDDFTPAQRSLQTTLNELAIEQCYFDYLEAPQTDTTYCYPARDTTDELQQMLYWIKQCLQEGKQNIGVVIPDLQGQSRHLQRLLMQDGLIEQCNISLGQALVDYPLVKDALQWLRLDTNLFSRQTIQQLLYSPYLAGAKERFHDRTHVSQHPLLQETYLSLAQFLPILEPIDTDICARLRTLEAYPTQVTCHEWIVLFKRRLSSLGFPGEYALNSTNYQVAARFFGLFDAFLQLSIFSPIMTREEALHAIETLARITIFQPKAHKHSVNILGLLEASGCTFDSLWISGLSDQCLPQKVQFSPFIPLDIQQKYAMPHAIPERELQFARQLITRFQRTSRLSVFSYPALIGEIPNLPSPLLIDFPIYPATTITKVSAHTTATEAYTENYTLPLTATTMPGGTHALAYQAQCPFRAFAAYRLHAHPLPSPSTGPNARERGQIIHRVLETIWRQLQTQQQLLQLSTNALDQLLETTIQHLLSELAEHHLHSFPPLIQSLEEKRLYALIHSCLAWEKERPAFTIDTLEQSFNIALGPLTFKVRVDRIDRLSNGDCWVIDYKSRLPNTLPWYDDRPDAPQLLLYALLDSRINGLIFLQLRAGQTLCSGLSQENIPIDGIKTETSWNQRQTEWHTALSELADELHQGHCTPTPTRDSTCTQCEFRDLCRRV